ncbi:MAG: hypothetical protein WCP85_28495, partial [Mariniphaga sp.]
MKIRLLIAAVLFSVLSFGQTPALVIRLAGPGAQFGQNVPAGTLLIDMFNNKEYLTLVALPSTGTITAYLPAPPLLSTASIKEISDVSHISGDVTSNANSAALTIGTDKIKSTMISAGEVKTVNIADQNVTFAKLPNIPTQKLLGNGTGSTASPEVIALGTNLNISGGTLTVSGVSSFAFTAKDGVTGSVATPLSAPNLTLTLGNITPTGVSTTGTISATGNITTSAKLVSAVAMGTAPLKVTSNTLVANLHAEFGDKAITADVATNIDLGTKGQILYQDSPGVTAFLSEGTPDYVLTSNGAGAVPEWKYSPKITTVQNLTVSATPGTYNLDPANGVNGKLTLTEDAVIKLVNATAGTSGSITVVPNGHTLKLDGSVSGGGVVYYDSDIKLTPPPSPVDLFVKTGTTIAVYNWYFDGLNIYFSGHPD